MKMFSILAIVACATLYVASPSVFAATELSGLKDVDAIAAATIVKYDDFKKEAIFIGPNVYKDPVPASVLSDAQRLHVSRNELKGTAYYYIQIAHRDAGKEGKYFEAYDSNGTNLKLQPQRRQPLMCDNPRMIEWCVNFETFTLEIDKKYLEDNKETGIKYKVIGKGGEFIDTMPPEFIKGFLKRLDEPVVKNG
jgi:hypothetical protein